MDCGFEPQEHLQLVVTRSVTWRLRWAPRILTCPFRVSSPDLTRCRISFQLISEYALICCKCYIQYFLVTFTMLPTFLTCTWVSESSSNPPRACSGLRALACALCYACVAQGAGEARVLLRGSWVGLRAGLTTSQVRYQLYLMIEKIAIINFLAWIKLLKVL